MKVIVSHDVDHWYLTDHLRKDLYLQKFLAKHLVYLLKRQLSWKTFKKRINLLTQNRMERLNELLTYDQSKGVVPQVFVGYSNGLSLSYSKATALKIGQSLSQKGVSNFPHGIEYSDMRKMSRERNLWLNAAQAGPKEISGIRMHYLRHNEETYRTYAKLGYHFASNKSQLTNPYFIEGILEFPVSMMDVQEITLFEESADQAIENSIQKIKKAEDLGLDFFTLNFHDVYFNPAFPQHRAWYFAVIDYMAANHEFTDFNTAYQEISRKRIKRVN